ncbi:lysozyme inhibitor LprI family protein [Oleiagrimonas sp. MCCC 1A03011]|uniref:lysozyme inhibitor LprI family protein n=1 Tax=Oleiagrimonas sp. MCCC 1A03011 TaxID=1926883 RepID=UPI000DC1FD6A|nr:lysozyme inhibitor LprI family protein [Oleiagrimonas sp. MCCC 1A03011]RAP58306.1 hypothetical protein BTJ49_04935 [Oleiagrimonas sp. MCCC 1A03011]
MIRLLPLLLVLLTAPTFASGARADAHAAAPSPTQVCTPAWYHWVDRNVSTRDAQQHGPDVGSAEWQSALEFRLGLRGDANLPARGSKAWCQAIDARVRQRIATPKIATTKDAKHVSNGPSFDCAKVQPGSIEALICREPALSDLDRKLAFLYTAASNKVDARMQAQLRAEQRGWIKGRDDCWKSDDRPSCVRSAYLQRIAELEARYRLVPSKGPQTYACDGQRANEVVVTFFETRPRTLIAERGDQTSLMFAESPEIYRGRNERIVLRDGHMTLVWGHGAALVHCEIVPSR